MEPHRSFRIGLVYALVAGSAAGATLLGVRNGSGSPGPVLGASSGIIEEPVRYGRDIRPILSDRCFKCHGPDAGKRQAGLRLDVREAAVAKRDDGKAALVAGQPEASELWRRVNHPNPEQAMPPPDSNKRPLSAEEKELVRRWIMEGAPYEPHWAFVPPRRPDVPAVRQADWCRNAVDRFVLARLEKEGVAPAPEADKETLIRRIFLDLTGLPPTPEEMDAFLADARPDAYERWVDKLLTQEPYRGRYAERMASPWMDAARYADTCGIHMDAGRQIWPWRDWILRAYRDNMPFDRFFTEQLAGDLLPNATEDQKVASGFNRNHVTTDEGGAIAEEYLVEYAVDRTATTGSVFLGLTTGCARCHDHKFDPLSQEEFYKLYSFFNSVEEPGLYSQLPDANRAFEPFMTVPTAEQVRELAELKEKLTAARAELNVSSPEEDAQRKAFFEELPQKTGLTWESAETVGAESAGGAAVAMLRDGSLLFTGQNPAKDDHTITLRTQATGLRMILLEALADASLVNGRVGRGPNGNAVLSGVEVEAASVADPTRRAPVRLVWAWADHEQTDGNYRVVNVLNPNNVSNANTDRGWAVGAHQREGGRVLLLLAETPFGFEGGTDVRVQLQYRSIYDQHVFGRVRLRVGRLGEAGLDALPMAVSGWHVVGPFPIEKRETAYAISFGPEQDMALDLARKFGADEKTWRYDANLRDEKLNRLPDGTSVTYVGRRIFAPSARKIELALGSDDGFGLYLNGREVAAREVDRAVAADQDRATLELQAGVNTLVFKIVNTGGVAGFYQRALPRADELFGDLAAAVLPEAARSTELQARLDQAWKLTFSPGYKQRKENIAALEKRNAEVDMAVPRTMIMKELPKSRETFVLKRGEYDKPDRARPVARGVPAALGKLPDGAPQNRLGLAQWLASADNPLTARVAVNRLWEMLFGTGIVRTSEDFGMQGEWPSHPELLDWLAVEFRESGWDTQRMLRLLLASSTYRQNARVRPELRERDPDNRWLAYFPRRRLAAETVRDQALYVSGLLVEKLGGPSVKPYQPDGLWPEVAMLQSNTRIFTRGDGPDLWRRSLYTYWKRACPPPSLATFDAPTRESCVIRRATTNTPLQALALWNDEQFVETARVLAQRTLTESGSDRERLVRMFRRCAGRAPDDTELARLTRTLADFRARYTQAPEDAGKLLKIGMAPIAAEIAPAELAAWTLIANALLNLSATISQS